jgi:flavin reductase (DIM6/NTAB) family NADH-FMN oxidoreductase RutF
MHEVSVKPRLSPDEFKVAFRDHPAGVAVVTADTGLGPVGLTATSVFSVSADPPILVFSLSDASSSTPTLKTADTVVVHLLGARDLWLAQLCATSGIDRFENKSLWERLRTGEPYFPSASRWIRAEVVSRTSAGTSTVVAVQALETGISTAETGDMVGDPSPLVYHNRTWHALGAHSQLRP